MVCYHSFISGKYIILTVVLYIQALITKNILYHNIPYTNNNNNILYTYLKITLYISNAYNSTKNAKIF